MEFYQRIKELENIHAKIEHERLALEKKLE